MIDHSQPEILSEMKRLVTAAQSEQIHLRLIGGVAIRYHSPSATHRELSRDYPDLDFVVERGQRRRLEPFFDRMGYVPDRRFNLLNGDRRQIFYDSRGGRRVDIFLGDFEMCHKLPMRDDRLRTHPITVPLTELFLSKTQIVELNRKDILDLTALLLDNEVGYEGEQVINLSRITRMCLKDWGLYKTLTINLNRLEHVVAEENPGLTAGEAQIVLGRVNTIRRGLERATKPLLWKVRDRVGTRVRWYSEVEEVDL
jgi:hypothetical protein